MAFDSRCNILDVLEGVKIINSKNALKVLLNASLDGNRLTREHKNVLLSLSKFYRASITVILYMHLSA